MCLDLLVKPVAENKDIRDISFYREHTRQLNELFQCECVVGLVTDWHRSQNADLRQFKDNSWLPQAYTRIKS